MDPIRVFQRCSSALMVFLGRPNPHPPGGVGHRTSTTRFGGRRFLVGFFLGGVPINGVTNGDMGVSKNRGFWVPPKWKSL